MALRALQGPAGGSAPVGGSGTTDTIPRWTGPSTLGDSAITDNGTVVAFGRNINATSTAGGASYVLTPSAGGQVFGQTVASSVWYLGRTTGAGAAVQTDVCINNSGNVGIGTASPAARLHSAGGNTGYGFACSGTTRAFRVEHNTTETRIVGVDNTLNASFQPLAIGGSEVLFQFSGVTAWRVNTSGHLLAGADNTYDIGASGATRPRIVYVGTGVVGGYIRAGAASAGVASTTTIGNGTSTTATAGAQTLPANPLGFIIAHVGTTEVRIPYYAV